MPFNADMAARLIHKHQQTGGADFKVEINPDNPKDEQKKKLAEIQHYVDHYRNKGGWQGDFKK